MGVSYGEYRRRDDESSGHILSRATIESLFLLYVRDQVKSCWKIHKKEKRCDISKKKVEFEEISSIIEGKLINSALLGVPPYRGVLYLRK